MTQLTELDYDSIENAVMETARGRWFLSEHKKRHGGSDTPKILDAIAKLEKIITSINSNEHTQPQPAQVSTAPFAPAAPFALAAIDIPTTPEVAASQPAPVTEENLQFFSNDEDLFSNDANSFLTDSIQTMEVQESPADTVEQPKIEASDIQEENSSADSEQNNGLLGDRFKIFKTTPAETPSQDAEIDAEVTNATSVEVPDPSLHPTPEEQDRIVVIRSATGEDINIPLADEFAETTENDQAVPAAN